MFERFTERARRVIILAREEAGRFRHDFVGAEHVLLGLIRDGEGAGTAVLQRLGLPLETTKAEVERALAGFPKTLAFGEVPFTPQAKRVLELSIEEARQLGHDYIGTEHLLLGLLKEGQSIAAKILESRGARLDAVRQEIPIALQQAPGDVRAAIARVTTVLASAVNASDVGGIVSVWTEDGVLMPPNHPTVQGHAALEQYFRSLFVRWRLRITFESSEVLFAGNVAFERVIYTAVASPAGGGPSEEDRGKGLHVYRRQANDSWKLAADIWNSDRPA